MEEGIAVQNPTETKAFRDVTGKLHDSIEAARNVNAREELLELADSLTWNTEWSNAAIIESLILNRMKFIELLQSFDQ